MPIHALRKHFDSFFSRLNPGSSFEQRAASEHQSIIRLIENTSGLAAGLSPTCYLQGSYRQQTAIYTINDVDIIARCHLPALPVALWSEQRWKRDELFETIAGPLRADPRYRDKVRYESASMCIKVDLGIKVEILPVVHRPWVAGSDGEPFLLYRPKTGSWENGYARRHQQHLSDKNAQSRTGGNFIPIIKETIPKRGQTERLLERVTLLAHSNGDACHVYQAIYCPRFGMVSSQWRSDLFSGRRIDGQSDREQALCQKTADALDQARYSPALTDTDMGP